MEFLQPPKPLSFEGDFGSNWKKWKQLFKVYLKATGAEEKNDKVKIAILLHMMGEEAQELYATFDISMSTTDSKKFDQVLQSLEDYVLPEANQSVERHKFNSRMQEEYKCVDSFVTALRCLRAKCGFGALRDDLIKDCIVCGIRDAQLKE
ncbi:hypothetical protein PR048_009624 [Dryococelus australis]|uniref:Gag protein n=1 Tax=Dryococelus australis TaxID=614101 RepID=A0ABQ9I0E1_9NEOP|nr:hypothetical protein PR048_009624 [Dryococelus australis]